ncbi:MAG: cytochrome c [Candidatus Hydrogenedentota bacterium]
MKHIRLKQWLAWGVSVFVLTGCHWDLWDQKRYEPLEQGDFWGEGESASRNLVEGTVPYQGAKLDTAYYAGMDANDDFITQLPSQVVLSRELLVRGQERFMMYCSPCHGAQGLGNGIIPKRGFPNPPSYTDQRLLEVPIGYFFDVMTNGFGRMYSYKSRVTVEDRWAIASYIRVLQFRQNATPDLMSEELLTEAKNPPSPESGAHGEDHGDDAGESHETNNEEEVQGEH